MLEFSDSEEISYSFITSLQKKADVVNSIFKNNTSQTIVCIAIIRYKGLRNMCAKFNKDS